jgi:hypothetical protein
MQIAKSFDRDLISEISLKCGDPDYRDFSDVLYAQAVFRSQRKIAREYGILEKRFTKTIRANDIGRNFILPPNFIAEFEVLVNGISMSKIDYLGEFTETLAISNGATNQYFVRFSEQRQWLFDYINKNIGDVVDIFYTSTGEAAEDLDGTPLLPDTFYEEIIKRSIIYMCELGIAKFQAEKRDKYMNLYKLYVSKKEDYDLGINSTWIMLKPFSLSYP